MSKVDRVRCEKSPDRRHRPPLGRPLSHEVAVWVVPGRGGVSMPAPDLGWCSRALPAPGGAAHS
ncbi:hypothetical protein ACBI99_44585 [Nonomuraea sp. ATR24]|uniref:hypothetical protein n=1 Tax=Nonomuraea sp. ATR24 TaxID=1676744 RepID=UPI0035BF09BE